jgi:hypothetical protein
MGYMHEAKTLAEKRPSSGLRPPSPRTRGEGKLHSSPALAHSAHAFIGARANGSQTRLFTPASGEKAQLRVGFFAASQRVASRPVKRSASGMTIDICRSSEGRHPARSSIAELPGLKADAPKPQRW